MLTQYFAIHPQILRIDSQRSFDVLTINSDNHYTFGEGPYAEITLEYTGSFLPKEFKVETAYPNPFNPIVIVPFALPNSGEVTIAVYNLLGQNVFQMNRKYTAGQHRFEFDTSLPGQELVSGMYFLRLIYEDQAYTQKIIMLK